MVDVLQHQWNRQNPVMLPASRKGSCMAYHAQHGVAVLFGGGGFNDTWHWDGQVWVEQRPSIAPPPRTNACMAYDAAHQCIVLFGGADSHGKLLDDTWTWDGSSWQQYIQQDPTTVPSPRCGASMTYDENRQCIVLFGGQTYGGRAGTQLNDTWIWNGSSWQQHIAQLAPPARLGASIVYHAVHRHVILFGGTNGNTTFNDTWTWDGSTWTKLFALNSPPVRAWASITYHDPTQHSVLIGGHSDGSSTGLPALNDIWAWNGTTWRPLPVSHVPAGGYHSAAYDAARQTIVLYATRLQYPQSGSKKA